VATEVRCLKENADYQLLPLASNMSSWAGASITVAVPGSETLLVFNGSAEDPAKSLGDGVFRVPEQKDSEVIHSVGQGSGRQWLSVVAQWKREGPAGFQGVLLVSGDVQAGGVTGPVRGALRMALASSVETVTNDVILMDARDSSSASGVGGGSAGRKLLARAAGAGKAAGSVMAGQGASKKLRRAAALSAAAGMAAGTSGRRAAARAVQAATAVRHLAERPQPYVVATHGWRRALQEDGSSESSRRVLISFKIIGRWQACKCAVLCLALLCSLYCLYTDIVLPLHGCLHTVPLRVPVAITHMHSKHHLPLPYCALAARI
jgi:hypothetical protein